MKRLKGFLKAFIFVQLGACAGRSLFICLDWLQNPGLYATNSAPWYTGILVALVFTAATVLITSIAYFIIDRIIRKNENDS